MSGPPLRHKKAPALPSRRPEQVLLSNQARKSLRPRDRRRVPFAGKRIRLRSVEPHGQIECTFRRGKPVGLLVLARVLVLEIEVERSVGIVFEWHPAADRKPIESVRDLIA